MWTTHYFPIWIWGVTKSGFLMFTFRVKFSQMQLITHTNICPKLLESLESTPSLRPKTNK
jgi:hypothetical protein